MANLKINVTEEQVKKHYSENLCQLPYSPQWRHLRFRLRDGTWRKLPRQIKSPKVLREWLLKWLPVDAYVSISCWLNPTSNHGYTMKKAGYKWLSNLLIRSDFLLDFDQGSPQQAEEQFKKAEALLKTKYDRLTSVNTFRGRQLWVLDWWDKEITKVLPNFRERIEHVKSKKIKAANWLRSQGVEFDYPQSINPYQVCRLWGSVHRSGAVMKVD